MLKREKYSENWSCVLFVFHQSSYLIYISVQQLLISKYMLLPVLPEWNFLVFFIFENTFLENRVVQMSVYTMLLCLTCCTGVVGAGVGTEAAREAWLLLGATLWFLLLLALCVVSFLWQRRRLVSFWENDYSSGNGTGVAGLYSRSA